MNMNKTDRTTRLPIRDPQYTTSERKPTTSTTETAMGTQKSKTPCKKSKHASGGLGISLEAGLAKVAAPSLERQDFGRDTEDGDTFCGTGTVDGEVKLGKLNIKNQRTANPFTVRKGADPFGGKDPFGGLSRGGGDHLSKPFGCRRDDSESDESDGGDVDFFASAGNPFRDVKTKGKPPIQQRRTFL